MGDDIQFTSTPDDDDEVGQGMPLHFSSVKSLHFALEKDKSAVIDFGLQYGYLLE